MLQSITNAEIPVITVTAMSSKVWLPVNPDTIALAVVPWVVTNHALLPGRSTSGSSIDLIGASVYADLCGIVTTATTTNAIVTVAISGGSALSFSVCPMPPPGLLSWGAEPCDGPGWSGACASTAELAKLTSCSTTKSSAFIRVVVVEWEREKRVSIS